MALLASLFSCCGSNDRSNKLEAECRHARIVAVTEHHPSYRPRPRSPPQRTEYRESPPEYKDIAQHPLISVDEKDPFQFQLLVDDEDDAPPPASPRSSIVSIPSTRLTNLTAAATGETTVSTRRTSLERMDTRGNLPPSYYSHRSPSPASSAGFDGDRERDGVWQHPVMAGNWLEALQQDAAAQHSQRRQTQTHIEANTRSSGLS